MAKIRGIKPETWSDEKIVALSPLARLLFIGSWNWACDNGHIEDSPIQLKIRILPADNCDVNELLDEIVAKGLMERDGGYLTVPNLTEHQRPHKRWWKTCDKPGCNVPEGASSAPKNRGSTGAQQLHNGGATVATPSTTSPTTADVDGDVDGEGAGRGRPADADRKSARVKGTRIPDDFTITDEMRTWANDNIPGIDIDAELSEFIDYWKGVPGQKGVKLDWVATWRNGMRKRREWRTQNGQTPQRPAREYTHDELMQLPVEKRSAIAAVRTTGNLR